jgi:hypothetical protein
MRVPLACVLLTLASISYAQDMDPVRQLRPHVQAFEACAISHLRSRAAAQPSQSFEDQEPSIQPACSAHVEATLIGLMRAGASKDDALGALEEVYRDMWPRLRSAYNAATKSNTAARENPAPNKSSPAAREAQRRERCRLIFALANDQRVTPAIHVMMVEAARNYRCLEPPQVAPSRERPRKLDSW